MLHVRLARHALTAMIAALLGACATSPAATSSGGGAAADAAPATADPVENTIRVDVNNNRADAGSVTIYIEPAAGVRSTLGTLGTGERKTFTYRVEAASRNVRLSAITASGQTMTSSMVTVPRGAGLTWDLQINSVRITR